MLDECEDIIGQFPSNVPADAGYWSKENTKLEDKLMELFIATTKDWKRRKILREDHLADRFRI